MLATVENLQALPGMNNTAAYPVAWLNLVLGGADAAIKEYCKHDIEMTSYKECYSGQAQRDIIVNHIPIWVAQTTIAPASSGLSLPQSTINVASTLGFPPGTGGNPNCVPPGFAVQVSLTSWTYVTYTGTTATTFTGCSGGSGILSSLVTQNRVCTPALWFDPQAYGGWAPPTSTGIGPFADSTIQAFGSQYMPFVDKQDGKTQRNYSERGLITKLGAAGGAFIGTYPETYHAGRLSSSRQPTWPRGDKNIQVAYTAGVYPTPFSLVNGCVMLAMQVIRTQPMGANLSNESLGAYSYSVLVNSDDPEIGDLRRTLARYRESSFLHGG